jgi:hypothetical protein
VAGHDRDIKYLETLQHLHIMSGYFREAMEGNCKLHKRRTERVEVRFCRGYSDSVSNNWIRDEKTS